MQPKSQEIIPGVLCISLPVPFNVNPVNVYFFDGEIPTIIDTGTRSSRTLEWLDAELRKAGADISKIQQVILTHGHVDHSGLAGKIQELSGATILIHPAELEELRMLLAPSEEDITHLHNSFKSWGLGVREIAQFGDFRHALSRLGVLPYQGIRHLTEGEAIQAGDYTLNPIFCPGHSFGLVCYYLSAKKALFCGDHVLEKISPNPCVVVGSSGSAVSGLSWYLESLSKLLTLDIDICLAGHGSPITDLAQRIREIQRDHELRQERFVSYLAKLGPSNLKQICLQFLQDLEKHSPENLFLGMREAFGQVSLLENKGIVEKELVQGIWIYSLT